MPVKRVEIRGAAAVIRAARKHPRDVRKQLDNGTRNMARQFARTVAAAGRADSRQSARAASTVRASTAGGAPAVVVGPHPLLFGSEFGMTRKSGWYNKARYYDSEGKQFRPHRGQGASYWFFVTAEREQPRFVQAHRDMARAILGDWSA